MAVESSFPAGKLITFTGRLASMSRIEAMRFVSERGGSVRDRVSKRTDVLVMGADGWPLRKSGAMTRNLSCASKLRDSGSDITIIGEAEFLRRTCGKAESNTICRQHTLEQLSRLLGVSGLRLRRWIQQGLVRPSKHDVVSPTFDFQEVAAARTLAALVARGVSTRKLTKSLRQLQRLVPDDMTLTGSIIALERGLLIRHGDQLIDPKGQLHFSFESLGSASTFVEGPSDELRTTAMIRSSENFSGDLATSDPDEWFDRAFRLQCDGRTNEAAECYRKWLENFGDDHEVLFNYANLCMGDGQINDAILLLQQCVNIAPSYAPAWNNLGLCKYQIGELDSGIDAMRRAVELAPDHVATLFNLADMLDEAGSEAEANDLWLAIANQKHCNGDAPMRAYACERVSHVLL